MRERSARLSKCRITCLHRKREASGIVVHFIKSGEKEVLN